MKKKLLLWLYTVILGFSINHLNQEIKINEVEEILLENDDDIESIINEYLRRLDDANFSSSEKEILKKKFIPFLKDYGDSFDEKYLANILSALENTNIIRDYTFSDTSLEAGYSNIICKLPFGNLFSDGVILLGKDYSEEHFFHEYLHSTQGWSSQKHIYGEAYSNFCAGGNYNDLYAVFTMLGDLGDREYLFVCLANSTMDDYWEYLKEVYPDLGDIVNTLRKNTEKTFYYTYKNPILLPEVQTSLREKVLLDISKLYIHKYSKSMADDNLYIILSHIYCFDDRYDPVNNTLLSNEFVCSYMDNDDIYSLTIDFENRENIVKVKKTK